MPWISMWSIFAPALDITTAAHLSQPTNTSHLIALSLGTSQQPVKPGLPSLSSLTQHFLLQPCQLSRSPRPQTHTANNGLSGFWCSFLCHSHNLMANSRWQPLCPDTTLQRSWPLATAEIASGQLHLCHPLFLGLNLLHHLFYVRNTHSGK